MEIEKIIALSTLFKRKITSEITEEQNKYLEQWKDSSDRNKESYDKMTNPNILSKVDKVKDYVDSKIALDKLLVAISRRKIRLQRIRIASFAAAIMAPIIIITALNYSNPQKVESVQRSVVAVDINREIIKSGTTQAVLYLASGKTINLNDTSSVINVNDEEMFLEEKVAKTNISATDIIKYNTLKIPRGGEFSMILSDGTRVWLNSDSEITFPAQFTGAERIVKVRGEVFFDVAKGENGKQRFIVETLTSKIEVLGTAFNVRCYADEYSTITLVRGEVKVISDNKEVRLNPGEQCLVESEGMNVIKVNTEEYVAWIDGVVSFKDKSLGHIMQNISRWYNVNIDFEQEELKDLIFTGSFKRYNDFNIIVDMFKCTGDIEFSIKDKHIVISKK